MNVKVLFDPLYGAVPFKLRRLGIDDFFYDLSTKSDEELQGIEGKEAYARQFSAILKTFEFSRLNFLRQAGFGWLVYPSATHTRYAHSLGCWYLAEQAMECVKVRESPGSATSSSFLMRWLEIHGVVEEFLLSLLLHDVGHFPFSHVLETNPRYKDISHEMVACQLIRGEGQFFDIFKEITLRNNRGTEYPRRTEFLSDALQRFKRVDVDILCTLISKDLSFVQNKNKPVLQTDAIPVMMELVSGVIDLDRIDHYHRDSHFMGLKVATVSPVALLANMVIISEKGTDPPTTRIELADEGVMQAFSLLESKETLHYHVFDNEFNVAYSTMLNAAVDGFIESNPGLADELLLWTDDFLISRLCESDDAQVKMLANRIVNCSPYVRVDKYSLNSPSQKNLSWIQQLRTELVAYLNVEHGLDASEADVLIAIPKGFQSHGKMPSDDWFKLDDIYDARGGHLQSLDRYSRRIRYFKESLETERKAPSIQIFTSDFDMRAYIKERIILKGYFA